ncbi:hypothetical protein [Pyrococcus abyssi]|uniref:Uncharacterized protein n=1 Tax=Pyrococcus abyssi (strain GE5 / Orsay) TaxID=272844 RepID=Q9UY59_PYRAB|nr:hypothetical protein [Pyrococcus abyssi]CAB50553.1 Hypothetical protein PAB1258 [Pyrococcus abyssi GE5]CCE71117.1 TPA: hypothetical protein PAB1258 [Pyrococcus abyssi GE5]
MKYRSFGIIPFLAFFGWGLLFGFLIKSLLLGNIIHANNAESVYNDYSFILDSFVFAILFGLSTGIGIGMLFVPKVTSKKLSGLVIGFQLSIIGIRGDMFKEMWLWWITGIVIGVGISLILILYGMKSNSERVYSFYIKIAKLIVTTWIAFLLWPLTAGIWNEITNGTYTSSNALYIYITSTLVLLVVFMMSWKVMNTRMSEESVPIIFIGTRKSGKTFLSLIHLTYLNKYGKGEYVAETPFIIGGIRKMTSPSDILRMIADDMRVIGRALSKVFPAVTFRDKNLQRIFNELVIRALMGSQIGTEVGSFSLYTLKIYKDRKSRILFGIPYAKVEFTDYAGEIVDQVEDYLGKYSQNPINIKREVDKLAKDLNDALERGVVDFIDETLLSKLSKNIKENKNVIRKYINMLINDLRDLNFDFRKYTRIFNFDSKVMSNYKPLLVSVFVLSRIKNAKKIGVLVDGESLLATMLQQATITGSGELVEVARKISEIEQLLERNRGVIRKAVNKIVSSSDIPPGYKELLREIEDPMHLRKILERKENVIRSVAVYLKLLQDDFIKGKDIAVIVTKSDIFTLLWGDRILTDKKNRERFLEKYVREVLRLAMPKSNYRILFSGAKLDPIKVIGEVYGIDEIVEWEVEDNMSRLIAEVVLP